MNARIRLATPDDVDSLFDIRTSVRENHLSRTQLAELGVTPEAVQDWMAAGECAWIGEVDGVAAGFSLVDLDDGCVFAVFIRPEREGLGLGARLLAMAEAALFERHTLLWLETDGASRASGFYARQGWQPVMTHENGDVRFEKRRPQPKNQ